MKVQVSEKLPVLKPEMFPKADIVPFTIAEVRHVPFRGDRGLQDRIILLSEEHGEHVLWPNMTSLRALVDKFGDEDAGWVGKTVPLVKVQSDNPRTGKPSYSFWVAGTNDQDAWDSVSPRASRGRPPMKSAAKRTRARR